MIGPNMATMLAVIMTDAALQPDDAQRLLLEIVSRVVETHPEIDYQDKSRSGWSTSRHLSNVLLLARAYRAPQSELCGDPELRAAVLSSLDHWLENDYRNPNWWWNVIGTPRTLLPVRQAVCAQRAR